MTAVCDTIPERADEAATAHNAKAFYDAEELLQSGLVDIVSLCTPSGIHPDHTIAAAKQGIHIVTEKPMATEYSKGLEMVKVCDEQNVNLYVVKQNRLNPTIQKLKEAVDNNRFGEMYYAQVNVFWTRPQDYYDQAKWRGTKELDGGALMNQASHYVDLLTWLMGTPSQVAAMTGTLGAKN